MPDLLSVTGSDCFVDFPRLISEQDRALISEVNQHHPLNTNGFELEADGPSPFD